MYKYNIENIYLNKVRQNSYLFISIFIIEFFVNIIKSKLLMSANRSNGMISQFNFFLRFQKH